MPSYNITVPTLTDTIVVTLSPPAPVLPVALGAWTPPGNTSPWDGSTAAHYARTFGRAPAIVHYYQDLVNWGPQFNVARNDEIAAAAAVPLISWELDDSTKNEAQPVYSNAAFVRGDHDAQLTAWIDAAAAWGRPFLLRPFWEMTGRWYPWAAGCNGNTAGSFVDAWRHVTGIVRRAPLARLVWTPSVDLPGLLPLEDLYPGDAYVDEVGMDGYNTGPSLWTKAWLPFDQIFRPTYDRLSVLCPTKPIVIAEVGCNTGGDRASWILRIPDALRTMPQIRSLVWWNNATTGLDCRLDQDAATLAAFKTIAADPFMNGRWG